MPVMAKPRLPYVLREKTRHGRLTWYFRRGTSARVRLPDNYGSAEFITAYNTALAGSVTPTASRNRAAKGTLAWLIGMYKASAAYAALAPSTRRMRDNILQRVIANAGNAMVCDITARTIRQGREDRARTPEAANNFLKVIKGVFGWALEADLIDHDPTRDVKKIRTRTSGFHTWTEDEIERFEQVHPLGTRARLALDLFAYTGLRRGDVQQLGPQHIKDGHIAFRAQKNGEWIHLPILPPLAASIAACETGNLAFMTTTNGLPFASAASFGNWFAKQCIAASAPGRAHGLRKAAAVLAAERGATENQLMAIFGWSSSKIAAIYTRAANRKKIGLEHGSKLDRGQSKNKVAPHPQ